MVHLRVRLMSRRFVTRLPFDVGVPPEEVAELVLFLATGSDFTTGETIVIDGGLSNVYFRL